MTARTTDQEDSLVIAPEIQTYLQNILKAADLYTTDEEFNRRMVAEIYLRLVNYLNMRLITLLPKEKVSELTTLLESNRLDDIDLLIRTNVPHAEETYLKLLEEFRDFYLGIRDLTEMPETMRKGGVA